MENLLERLGALPGAVWIIVAVLLIIAIVVITKHGSNKYELTFFLSWSMFLSFFSFVFMIGGTIYYFASMDGGVVPDGVATNAIITSIIGICFLSFATYRNIKQSNLSFGVLYSIAQATVSFSIFLGVVYWFQKNKN